MFTCLYFCFHVWLNTPLCFRCLYGTVLEAAGRPGTVPVAGNGSGNVIEILGNLMEILGNLMEFYENPKEFIDS